MNWQKLNLCLQIMKEDICDGIIGQKINKIRQLAKHSSFLVECFWWKKSKSLSGAPVNSKTWWHLHAVGLSSRWYEIWLKMWQWTKEAISSFAHFFMCTLPTKKNQGIKVTFVPNSPGLCWPVITFWSPVPEFTVSGARVHMDMGLG